MQLLISTPLHLLLYDTDRKTLLLIEEHRPEYYGISWTQDGQHLILSHSGIDNNKLLELADYALSERGWISCGVRESWKFLSQPHQLVCGEAPFVLVSNTGRNALSRVNLTDFSLVQRRYGEALWDKLSSSEKVGSHFNSLFVSDGRVYFLAHNNGRDSFVLILDAATLNLLERIEVSGHSHMHNLWLMPDGRLVGCESHRGHIVDCRSREVLWESHGDGYVRGLASDGRHLYIGSSEVADRLGRRGSEAGLWVVDLSNWATVDYILLGNYGNVHELRILDVPDLCHHGIPFQRSLSGTAVPLGSAEASRVCPPADSQLDPLLWHRCHGVVLKRSNGDYCGIKDQFGLALLRDRTVFNGQLDVEIELARQSSDDYMGFVFRHQGENDDAETLAVLCQHNAGSLYISLWKSGASWQWLTHALISQISQVSLTVILRGPDIHIATADRPLLDWRLDDELRPGSLGIRLMGDAIRARNFVWHDDNEPTS